MRTAAIARREAIPVDRRQSDANLVAALPLDDLGLSPGRVVSAYCAMGAEFDPEPLLRRLAAGGLTPCLPVLTPLGRPLTFRRYLPGDPLETVKWGIRQPFPDRPEVEPDVLLVPLLAFDARGWRLGYGGAYYDRTIAGLRARRSILAVGLAFDEQEVDAVPRDGYDQRLDLILTPSGLRRPRDM